MKQDRFLISILAGIVLLIVVALGLFFTRKDTQTYRPDDTPEGVTYNYALAVINRDYQKAYGYLAELDYKPTYEQFRQSFFGGAVNPGQAGLDVGKAEIDGDAALVELTLIHSASDPFSGGYSNSDRAQLVRQNGEWKVKSMPTDSFWDYNWYQKPVKSPND
jgi:hypothetical protein